MTIIICYSQRFTTFFNNVLTFILYETITPMFSLGMSFLMIVLLARLVSSAFSCPSRARPRLSLLRKGFFIWFLHFCDFFYELKTLQLPKKPNLKTQQRTNLINPTKSLTRLHLMILLRRRHRRFGHRRSLRRKGNFGFVRWVGFQIRHASKSRKWHLGFQGILPFLRCISAALQLIAGRLRRPVHRLS